MDVSGQANELQVERGPRARTRRLMVAAASRLMQQGEVPSVSEVAEAADVSRATAYRYFPSQAALVQAVVDEALGPILAWKPGSARPEERVRSLLEAGLPRIGEFEATFRAALKLSLDQPRTNTPGEEGQPPFKRGRRMALLREAIAPLAARTSPATFEKLQRALSLLFGVEALIVLKDIWGDDQAAAEEVIAWAADILIRGAAADPQGQDDAVG